MTVEGPTKVVNFMPSGARVWLYLSYRKNALFLLYFKKLIRQTKHILIMTGGGFTKMINFITLKAGLLMLGHIVKMHYFFKNLLLYSGV